MGQFLRVFLPTVHDLLSQQYNAYKKNICLSLAWYITQTQDILDQRKKNNNENKMIPEKMRQNYIIWGQNGT